jgi:exosortase A-associated hydrolase 1
MRRLLSFLCEGESLGATLEVGDGPMGVLIVTGGTQTRIGSHRMFERLALRLAEARYSCLRFDRRGVGESSGEDPDFRGNASDIEAAAEALREQCPQLRTIIGFGLCDGATSLALFGKQAGLSGLILVNPWFVEAAANEPAAAAIKQHYRDRLLSLDGWKKLLSGSISYKKLLKGLMKVSQGSAPGLADEVREALISSKLPTELILARSDATAIAAADAWKARIAPALAHAHIQSIESDSHTFSRPGDMAQLEKACLASLARFCSSGGD